MRGPRGALSETAIDLGRVTEVRRLCGTGKARRLRIKAGASLREVADAVASQCGYPVSQSSVYRWETGDVVLLHYLGGGQGELRSRRRSDRSRQRGERGGDS